GPATAATGQFLSVTWTVLNQGIGVTTTDQWADTVALATDPAGTQIVGETEQYTHEGTLGIDGAYTHTVDFFVPHDLPGGIYYLVVETGGPYEFLYTDNNRRVSAPVTITFSPTPDLTPIALIAVPTTANSGEMVDVTWSVQNIGGADATGQWIDL